MVIFLTLMQIQVVGAECPDFHTSVQGATESLWIGDISSLDSGLQQVEASLRCSTTVNADSVAADLGEYFLLKAYDAHLKGATETRDKWLQQSINAAYWNPNFGAEVDAMRSQFQPTEKRVVQILPIPSVDLSFRIDGQTVDSLDMTAGVHWVEIYHQEQLLKAQFLHVQSETFVTLDGLPERAEVQSNRKSGLSPWASLALLAASGTLSAHTIAMLQHQQYVDSTSLDELEQLRTKTWRWGIGSISSGVLALGSLCMWTLDSSHMKNSEGSVSEPFQVD